MVKIKCESKKYIILPVIILLIVGVIFMQVFTKFRHENKVRIIGNESFFSEYSVDGNNVYIKCEITVINRTSEVIKVGFFADFLEDVQLGLLKDTKLKGYKEDKRTEEFYLQKGQNRIVVVFIGEFAGTNQKANRNLPLIEIVLLSD